MDGQFINFHNKDLMRVLGPYIKHDMRIEVLVNIRKEFIDENGITMIYLNDSIPSIGFQIIQYFKSVDEMIKDDVYPDDMKLSYTCYSAFRNDDGTLSIRGSIFENKADLDEVFSRWFIEQQEGLVEQVSCDKIGRPDRFKLPSDLLGDKEDDGTLEVFIVDAKTTSKEFTNSKTDLLVFGYYRENEFAILDRKVRDIFKIDESV